MAILSFILRVGLGVRSSVECVGSLSVRLNASSTSESACPGPPYSTDASPSCFRGKLSFLCSGDTRGSGDAGSFACRVFGWASLLHTDWRGSAFRRRTTRATDFFFGSAVPGVPADDDAALSSALAPRASGSGQDWARWNASAPCAAPSLIVAPELLALAGFAPSCTFTRLGTLLSAVPPCCTGIPAGLGVSPCTTCLGAACPPLAGRRAARGGGDAGGGDAGATGLSNAVSPRLPAEGRHTHRAGQRKMYILQPARRGQAERRCGVPYMRGVHAWHGAPYLSSGHLPSLRGWSSAGAAERGRRCTAV